MVNAQDTTGVQKDSLEVPRLQVKNILISGNIKTKEFVILREMRLKKGDFILTDHLQDELEKTRISIYNTTLFSEVAVYPVILNPRELDIIITLKEKWYLLPIPHLELADRSFNEWVKTHHADLKRLSWGIRFTHQNFSGRKDELAVNVINGFKRNLSLQYNAPYFNRALTKGLKLGVGVAQTREIPYSTSPDNKLLYYEDGGYEKNEYNATASYTFRKGIKTKGTFTVDFRHIDVSDTIIQKLNPRYFNSSSRVHDFIDLEYQLKYDNVDNVMYPLKGDIFTLSVKKRGLGWDGGINRFSVEPGYSRFFTHKNEWYTSLRLSAEIKLPLDQPYFNLQALGYGNNYLRGYEYHVMDGVAFGLSKFDLKKKIAAFRLPPMVLKKITDVIPFTFYAKTFADIGYVYNRDSSLLGNRFLYSGGLGIDIVTIFDLKVSVEYSLNQLGQKGLFLHD